jgi:hypothetical protein
MSTTFVVTFFDSSGQHRLGSDGTAIFKDLKTLSGAKNRLSSYRIAPWAQTYKIFQVPSERFYNEDSWRQVAQGQVAHVSRSPRRVEDVTHLRGGFGGSKAEWITEPKSVHPRDANGKTVLGDVRYDERHKVPKWSRTVTVLDVPKLFPRVFPELTRTAHKTRAATFLAKSKKFDKVYASLVKKALAQYGDGNGHLISGVYRDHFPELVKEKLRFYAHGASMLRSAARAHQDAVRMRGIAPSPRVNKWSHKVQTHGHVPAGLFKKSAAAIAHGLMKVSRDERQAMSRLNFYENRAGRNLSTAARARLDRARQLLEHVVTHRRTRGSRSPRKASAAHLWHIAKAFGPNKSYVVSIGDPYNARSKVMAILPNREELYDWIRNNVGVRVSPTHVHDMTGLKKVQALLDEKRVT